MKGAVTMTGPVIYLDRFTVRKGELESFRRYAEGMTELVKAREPGAVMYHYFVDESSGSGTAVFVFADAAALDLHLDVMSAHFQEAAELLSSTDIELLGRASERAQQMATAYGGTVKASVLAGFARDRR
jgi:quinol monooxygenase YgiN